MPSSFFELSVASTGLFTAKGALNVVGHNMSNAATTGYSRQLALVRARTPLNYQNGRGMIGTGSEVYGIGQVRSFFIDTKYWSTSGRLGEYSAKTSQNMLLQSIFNETDDTGFNVAFNSFFEALTKDLSGDSGNMTARINVIETAKTLATQLNATAASLERQQQDINFEIKSMVSQINNYGQQIQNLNKQIYTSELDGQMANDLRDKRALILDELAKYVNIDVTEIEVNKNLITGESEKRLQVSINGYDFINHFSMNNLECKERTSLQNPGDIPGIYDIYWNSGVQLNSEFSMKTMGGELKGLLLTRDGNNKNNANPSLNVDYKGIPYFMAKIDRLAQGLALAVNLGQDAKGNDLFANTSGFKGHYNSYNLMDGVNTGYNFFSYDVNGITEDGTTMLDHSKITAKNIRVAQELLDDPKALAAAWSKDGTPLNPDISDNTALLELLTLKHNPSVFVEGEFGNYIESIIGELGIITNESITFVSNYTDIQSAITDQRLSVSSVDLNEEMTAMIQLQQMYNACAKLISVIDGIYDTTINKMG